MLTESQNPSSNLPAPWPLYASADFAPKMRMFADHGELVVKADLPGVDQASLKVVFDGEELLIEGERLTEYEVYHDGQIRQTREAGVFRRLLAIDFDLDPRSIKTSYHDGVLEIRLPITAAPAGEPANEDAVS